MTGTGYKMDKDKDSKDSNRMEIVWRNVLVMTYLHVGAVMGCYYWFTNQCCWQTILFGFLYGYMAAFGVTCGTHRLWAHRAYKANLPLRIMLCFMQTSACQNSIHEWCRDHRVHHKFSETDADPHNSRRGFFFAHMGWLLTRKHIDVKEKGGTVSLKDLEEDPVVMFQKKWFVPLTVLCCFIIPTWIPVAYWGEGVASAWSLTLTRYVLALHATWLVNSAAHIWGNRPYDKSINPAENRLVSFITPGEGWHNYHHVFPWDYKAAELPDYFGNLSTAFIDFFAWIGWATELKTVKKEIVVQRMKRTGEGSCKDEQEVEVDRNENHRRTHHTNNKEHKHELSTDGVSWGWDDEDTCLKDKQLTTIISHIK